MRGHRLVRTGLLVAVLAAGAATVLPVGTVAQTPPEQQVDHRQAQMNRFAGAVRVLTQYVRNNQGSPQEVQTAAATIRDVAQSLPELFPRGTQRGVGDSRLKPEIWEQDARFREIVQSMQAASAGLADAAATGDNARIRQSFGEVTQICGTCHSTFRAD